MIATADEGVPGRRSRSGPPAGTLPSARSARDLGFRTIIKTAARSAEGDISEKNRESVVADGAEYDVADAGCRTIPNAILWNPPARRRSRRLRRG